MEPAGTPPRPSHGKSSKRRCRGNDGPSGALRLRGWIAYSDTYETINALAERGVRMGLVSNVGFDLRPILEAHGLDQLARNTTLSFEQHVAKPSPEIFRHALESLDSRAKDTLMVGDDQLADGGAAALGIRTLILPMSPPGASHGLDSVLEVAAPS